MLVALGREPLTHFAVIGAIVFLAVAAHRSASDMHRIVITSARADRLAAQFRMQFGDAPSHAQLDALIARDIDEEVLYREGAALGLGRDDEIVRRRIVQKMQFLQQDIAAPSEPAPVQLRAYFKAHSTKYEAPAQVAFSQIYFSPDRGGVAAAQARAIAVMRDLDDRVVRAPERGDAFADANDYAAFSADDALRLFGDTEMARNLFRAPVGRWAGPFRSGYGVHLVRVQSATPGRVRRFEDVVDAVRADVMADAQAAQNRAAFSALKAKFTIVRQDLAQDQPARGPSARSAGAPAAGARRPEPFPPELRPSISRPPDSRVTEAALR
jgi:peptidyl-prolyl cis-trans isomerase C